MRLYVTNQEINTPNPPSVVEYLAGSSGNAIPAKTIAGAHTLMEAPMGLFVDSSGNIFVANSLGQRITQYSAKASGNTVPVAIIQGSLTLLGFPVGVALDSLGNIYVTNGSPSNSVTEYAPDSTGNVAPIATLFGAHTGLQGPSGIVVDGSGNIYVANSGAPSVTEYAPGSTGDAAPIETISGGASGLNAPRGLALDSSGNVYVANGGVDSVTEYAAGLTNSTPIATISGVNTLLSTPNGVAVDSTGNVYVTNFGSESITEYASGATGDVAPIVIITGPQTGLGSPGGIAIASSFPLPTPTATATPTPRPTPRDLSLSPRSIQFLTAFDTVPTPAPLPLTIVNRGNSAVTGDVDISALRVTRAFKVTGAGSFKLSRRNDHKTVKVRFLPPSPGTFAGNINVSTDDPGRPSISVPVSGTAQSGTLKVPTLFSFGKVTVGKTVQQTLAIQNIGPGVLHGKVNVRRVKLPFTTLSGSGAFKLRNGATRKVTVQFQPPAKKAFFGQIEIISDDPQHFLQDVFVLGAGM